MAKEQKQTKTKKKSRKPKYPKIGDQLNKMSNYYTDYITNNNIEKYLITWGNTTYRHNKISGMIYIKGWLVIFRWYFVSVGL